ncbi:MAG: hypothetical protein LBR47_00445 [Spirochaetaceae bacterium]|nr:hypothetical protein [Spirochaetaceae bacterium]
MKEYFSDFDFEKPTSAMKYITYQTVSTHDEKHGRIEDRDYAVSDDVKCTTCDPAEFAAAVRSHWGIEPLNYHFMVLFTHIFFSCVCPVA